MQRPLVMIRQRAQPGLPHKIISHPNGAVWPSQANLFWAPITLLGTVLISLDCLVTPHGYCFSLQPRVVELVV
jgi:hypothetical protein